MKKVMCFLCFILAFAACNKEESVDNNSLPENKERPRFYGVKTPLEKENSIVPTGVAQYQKLWHPNATVNVKFLDGSVEYKNTVQQAAAEWGQYIGLNLNFVETGNADVRITFSSDTKYLTWSYTGTDCKYIRNQNEATANFADWEYIDPEERMTDALRVFGMILGLEMEHRHIDCTFTATYLNQVQDYWEDYIDDIDWDELKEYVFDPLNENMITRTDEIDLESIMVWPFTPAKYRPNSSYRANETLSETDIEFIQTLYFKPLSGYIDAPDSVAYRNDIMEVYVIASGGKKPYTYEWILRISEYGGAISYSNGFIYLDFWYLTNFSAARDYGFDLHCSIKDAEGTIFVCPVAHIDIY